MNTVSGLAVVFLLSPASGEFFDSFICMGSATEMVGCFFYPKVILKYLGGPLVNFIVVKSLFSGPFYQCNSNATQDWLKSTFE